jgi:Mrp family chromosome partitioning ATPase
MGEITEALRRAREGREPAEAAAARQPAAASAAPGRAAHRSALPGGGPAGHPPLSERHLLVPEDRLGDWAGRAVLVDRRGAVAESCRHLALRLRKELERRKIRTFAVAGPLREEGKTTLACDVALALATLSPGRRVALVDLDLRRPSVAEVLRLPSGPGIDDYLGGSADLAGVRVSIEAPELDVFPAREPRASAHELLVGGALPALVAELERRYAVTVFDTPPALLVPDVKILLEHVKGYAAVGRSGRTRRRAFEHMVRMLDREGLLGAILNEGQLPTSVRHYGYYADPSAGRQAGADVGAEAASS